MKKITKQGGRALTEDEERKGILRASAMKRICVLEEDEKHQQRGEKR